MTAQEYLKAIRETGLTQAEIAERTKVAQGTISKIERGEVKDVLSATYLALKALHDDVKPGRRAGDKPKGRARPKAHSEKPKALG